VRSIGGREKPPRTSSFAPQGRPEREHRALEPARLVEGRRAGVDDRDRLGGDDVRGGPSTDHADVGRGAGGGIGDPPDGEDLMGELDDRADPLLGLDPRVRRAALDLQGEVADPLARRLQPAARQGRFHHEHVGTPPRLVLDEGA